MKKWIFIILMSFSGLAYSQDAGTMEAGIDANFWSSTLGGTLNVSPRFGYALNDDFVVGPSVRFIHYWGNYWGIKSHMNIFGLGLYGHYRFANWLYAGLDVETYFVPFNMKIDPKNKYKAVAPAILLSFGVSRQITSYFRLNIGIHYDVLNDVNSPLRTSYTMRNAKGVWIPIFYRLSFIFNLNNKSVKAKNDDSDEDY